MVCGVVCYGVWSVMVCGVCCVVVCGMCSVLCCVVRMPEVTQLEALPSRAAAQHMLSLLSSIVFIDPAGFCIYHS